MGEFKNELAKGHIQKAYQGLMLYILELKSHFAKKYQDYEVSSSLYNGYMDMTYFALVPQSLKSRKLKIAVVFVYDTFRFEVWLAGVNKEVQNKYWKILKEKNCNEYRIPATTKGKDSILEYTLAESPDFTDKERLTKQIEDGTLKFIGDIMELLPN
jgi:hypothetical protein